MRPVKVPPGPAPFVSIVTPSFNQGRFIRATIESVLGQGYPHLEYIVMDGGSTDETVAILKEYGDRLSWVSEPDRGQADAINRGWQRSRGAVIAYLNSDDLYLPDAVERAVAALEAHPGAGAVYGEGYHVDEAGRVLERYPTEPFSLARLQETCIICQPATFLRREVVERAGWLDPSLRYCMDYDLWIRMAGMAPLVHIPEYLAHSRLHASTKTLGQRLPAHAEILETVRRHFGCVPLPWIYAYANAALGPRPRSGAWARTAFAGRLALRSATEFLRRNRGIPRREWGRWARRLCGRRPGGRRG